MESCKNCPILKKSIFCSVNEDNLNFSLQKKQLVFKKGKNILNHSSAQDGIFCIKKGSIKISKLGSDGSETIVRIANEGDILGEEKLLTNYENEKSATTITDAVVCYIDRSNFNYLLSSNVIGLSILKKTASNLRNAEEHICSCHQKKVISRLSELLIDFKIKSGILDNNRWKIDLGLSRQEIAMLVGTAPETAIRSITELKRLGIISGQKTFYINDLNALEKIARGIFA